MSDTTDGVLLIHAFPLDARMWHEQVETLRADGWRLAAPSMPGFGGTSTAGMPSSRARALACRGPAPPNATRTKSRGS